jgi:hypothetical protein
VAGSARLLLGDLLCIAKLSVSLKEVVMSTGTRAEPPPQSAPFVSSWHVIWFAVFVANLPLPLLLGLGDSTKRDFEFRAGVGAGLLVALVVSHLAIAHLRRFRAALVCGGLCVALVQVFVIPHVVVGFVAAVAVVFFVDPTGDFARGFWLTIATGGLLMTAALGCGLLLDWPKTWSKTRAGGERS